MKSVQILNPTDEICRVKKRRKAAHDSSAFAMAEREASIATPIELKCTTLDCEASGNVGGCRASQALRVARPALRLAGTLSRLCY